jgi:hypothetical protein
MVTLSPGIILLVDALESEFGLRMLRESPHISGTFIVLGVAVSIGSGYFYGFAHVTIIVQFVLMFLSLRSLPPGAYHTVAWSSFIPHINL